MLLALLAAAPFAGYLLLFIDIVGLEVAFACLVILIKPALLWVQEQADIARLTFRAIAKNFHSHIVSCPKIYFSHAMGSSALFALTGVMAITVVVWLPVFIVGVQYA